MVAPRRCIRVGNVSGATGDAPLAFARMVREGDVDVITGDWLSEMNIAWNAIARAQDPATGYETGFLEQLSECIEQVAVQGIKVITNAGALNPRALSRELVVATVVGDDVSHFLSDDKSASSALHWRHLDDDGVELADWDSELRPTCAVAYMGAWGIVEALAAGADIVVCGRVTDASPVLGAAAWWHGWSRSAYTSLAGSLVAGHIIECGPYAVGANYSGFKAHLAQLVDVGFPVAEIAADGSFVVTKPPSMNGVVGRLNIIAQLLYELQGELYLNPDVTADLSDVAVEETGINNRVRVSGAQGMPPPATTKVMVAAPGGYQAETTYYINGLDIEAKACMMEAQVRHALRGNRFSKLSVELYGRQDATVSPRSQQQGTAMLRVFAQARRRQDIAADQFRVPMYSLRMQSYPGYHMNLDFRSMDPRPFMELFPGVLPLDQLDHRVLIPHLNLDIPIPPSPKTAQYPTQRCSYETAEPVPLESFGPTVKVPLGAIVHARSGDKANNSNVGFFVRAQDEYPWLQSFLTVDRLRLLLEDDYKGQRIERVEFPRVWAVHFRIMDFLDGGIASSSRIDGLGKGVGEYLRSKHVQIPVKFLDRGWI
ncbi:hypothetical protein ANO11243_018030 [Dothideomycetidae sp. 11243]|nr:hypothetical protein ANO11243_018030 [fungal sp. No.11243]